MVLNLGSSRHLPDTGLTSVPWRGLPLLVGAAGTGPQLDRGLVGLLVAVDVHALAVDLDGPVSFDRPVLLGAAVAVPDHYLRVVRMGVVAVIDALRLAVTGDDRARRHLRAFGVTVAGALAPESPAVVCATTVML